MRLGWRDLVFDGQIREKWELVCRFPAFTVNIGRIEVRVALFVCDGQTR